MIPKGVDKKDVKLQIFSNITVNFDFHCKIEKSSLSTQLQVCLSEV